MRNDSVIYDKMELDSHADTVVLGKNCVVLAFTGRECDVSPYTETYESIKGVPIVTGASAWTCPDTSETIILVFHEALWMGDVMSHSLINPNQLRHHGVVVQDNPFDKSPLFMATEDDEYTFPLHTEGTIIYLPTRTPTHQELQVCRQVHLTSASEWNPRDVKFPVTSLRAEEGILLRRVNALQCQSYRQDSAFDDEI